ncbi:hypothetical protein [Cupriavidus metallidurans]
MTSLQYRPIAPLMNIDGMLKTLTPSEATGLVVDAYVRAHAFNFVDIDRHPEFIVALVTHNEQLWGNILKASDRQCWLHEEGTGFAIFEPNAACGATTIYQWTPGPNRRRRFSRPQPDGYAWQCFDSEPQFLSFLRDSDRPEIYSEWVMHQNKIHAVPTELAEGRLANTTVEKAMIYSRGDGCAFCGSAAPAYAATTICDGKLFLQLPVCQTHLEYAKAAPTVLSVLAELLYSQIDLPLLQRHDHIPDEYVVLIVNFLAGKLAATASQPEKRHNGWHTVLTRPSGWRWVLRLRALHDYAYMLLDPNKKERHRIDSAPDHPDGKRSFKGAPCGRRRYPLDG